MARIFALPLLLALGCAAALNADEPKPIVDLKERDKGKPLFVLVCPKKDDCKATIEAMEKVAQKYDIGVETWQLDQIDEHSFRRDVLLLISVYQKIQIHQSNKAKQLYPHLVIYVHGKPLTYYPQMRRGEREYPIDVFLSKLQEGKFVGLEMVAEVRRSLKAKP